MKLQLCATILNFTLLCQSYMIPIIPSRPNINQQAQQQTISTRQYHKHFIQLYSSSNPPAVTGLAHSGMTIDEIKSELEMRGVDCSDCVSRQELVQKLEETRVLGKQYNSNTVTRL